MPHRILGTLFLLVAISFPAYSQVTLAVSNGSGTPGSTVTLNISLGGGANPSGLQWDLNYPAAVDFESATAGPAAGGKSVQCSGRGGVTTCVVLGFDNGTMGNGVVARVTFRIQLGTAATSAATTLNTLWASSSQGQIIPISGSGGQIRITQPPPAPAITLTSLTCSSSRLVGGGTRSCEVSTSAPATAPGVTVNLAETSSQLTVPASVQIAGGSSKGSFTVSSGLIQVEETVQLTATLETGSQTRNLNLVPLAPTSLSCSPSQIAAGGTVTCEVKLNSSQFSQGVSLSISSDSAALSVPSTVSVPPGVSKVNFQASSEQSSGQETVQITALLHGVEMGDTVVIAAPSPVEISALTNAASYSTNLSCNSGSLATLWGAGFAPEPGESATGLPLPAVLSGVRVQMNGVSARLLYVGPTQINLQCPSLPPGTNLQITVERTDAQQKAIGVHSLGIPMTQAAPGIFSLDGSGAGQGVVVIANSGELASLANPGIPSRPAHPGDYLTIYATGLGPVDHEVAVGEAAGVEPLSWVLSEVRARAGTAFQEVTFAGLAPGFAGLYQVNILLLEGAPIGPEVPVTLQVVLLDGTLLESNEVTIAIE